MSLLRSEAIVADCDGRPEGRYLEAVRDGPHIMVRDREGPLRVRCPSISLLCRPRRRPEAVVEAFRAHVPRPSIPPASRPGHAVCRLPVLGSVRYFWPRGAHLRAIDRMCRRHTRNPVTRGSLRTSFPACRRTSCRKPVRPSKLIVPAAMAANRLTDPSRGRDRSGAVSGGEPDHQAASVLSAKRRAPA